MARDQASVRVKVCGITRMQDAVACVEAGVDAIGLNFWPRSKRRCSMSLARDISGELGGAVRVVGVVVNAQPKELAEIRSLGIRWLQLHGDESAESVRSLGSDVYKAVSLRTEADVEEALHFPGPEILVDSADRSARGGTGEVGDWGFARRVAVRRSTWLAGGLNPDNVRAAVASVRPYGVDCASGVETAPGIKESRLIRRFVSEARDER